MQPIEFIEQVFATAKTYLKETQAPNMADFTAWMQRNQAPIADAQYHTGALNSDLLMHLIELFKFGKSYAKIALQPTAFNTLDEVVFMLALVYGPPTNKTNLIEQNLLEKTSGTEVIKRLLKQGYVEEIDSETDKREKLLKSTPLGQQKLQESMQALETVSEMVSANLNPTEKQHLWLTLEKLRHFHWEQRPNVKQHKADINSLHAAFFSQLEH